MLVSLLGLPGTGKSTIARQLEELLGAVYAHPGRFAVAAGLVDRARPQRDELAALPGLAPAFLASVAKTLETAPVVMDGFPRTRDQAKKLVETGWKVQVIHLVFPSGQETEMSIARQQKRVDEDGVTDLVARSSMESQTKFALEHDLGAVEELRSLGVTVHEIDAMQSAEEVLQSVIAVLDSSQDNRRAQHAQ